MSGANQLVHLFQDSAGWLAPAVAAVGAALGLGVWLLGERLLRPIAILIAAVLGALAGILLLPLATRSEPTGSSLLLGAALGLALGAGAGWLAFRWMIIAAMGLTLSSAAVLLALAALPLIPAAHPDAPVWAGAAAGLSPDLSLPPDLAQRLHGLADRFPGAQIGRAAGLASLDALVPSADSIRELASRWSPREQGLIVLSALVGGGVGLFLGVSAPRLSARLLSSALGAACAIACAAALSLIASAPWVGALDRPAAHWALLWGSASALGLIAQPLLLRRRVTGTA